LSYLRLFSFLLLFSHPAFAQETHIILKNGDNLTVHVLEHTTEFVTIKHDSLGTLTIDTQQIESISPTETEVVSAEQVEEDTETEVVKQEVEADSGLFGTGILSDWERRFDLGIAGRAGKSKNMQINAGFTADFEDEQSRISHKTAYYRSESDGELSAHSLYSQFNKDWLQNDSEWFYFAGGKIDFDEFKDWDYRLSGNGGMGYDIYDTETFLLSGRAGLGFSQTFGGAREEFIPEGLLGIDAKWDISEVQEVKFSNTLYPNLKESSEFRNLTSLDWTLDLTAVSDVALKVGLLNEYDSATEDGISKNDFKYTVSLSWSL
jgi:putative salt-induced outer membrane protein YdiY